MRRFAQPIDRTVMRKMNENTLLNLIRSHAPVSRTQLKELSGLSLGTIMGITSSLIEQQLVIETGVAESTGGRKAGLLEMHPEGGYAIGISLMEQQIIGAVLNLNGSVLYERTWSVPLRKNSENAVELIATGVEAFIEYFQVPREKIVGLGCGVSGPVRADIGVSVDSWILDWHNVPLVKPLTERLAMPVFVDNAVNCLACYENLYGHGEHYRDFLTVTLGRGLGMAVVLGNKLFRGSKGIGAEFGHFPMDAHGRLCECGNIGCFEAYISDHGIVRTYQELCAIERAVNPWELDFLSMNALFLQAQQGDKRALQAFEQAGTMLGVGLAGLINLFNPECIIINGGQGHRVELMAESMKMALRKHTFSQIGNDLVLHIDVDTTMLNWARGAGSLVLQDFYAYATRV